MSPSSNIQDLEAKIDKILEYQKGAYHWAIARAVFDFLIVMVFIVIPIIGSFYLYKYIATQVDFGKLGSQYGEITKGLDQLNTLNQAGAAQGQLKGVDLQGILNKINP